MSVASELRGQFPDAAISAIRLGTTPLHIDDDARRRTRGALGLSATSIVFAVFGKITAEKRVEPILRALDVL